MTYRQYITKRAVEDVIIFPFVTLGRALSLFSSLKKDYEIIFFFPFYHTGGAEKVHLQIAHAVGNSNCKIFFTRKSADKTFLTAFKHTGCNIRDISSYLDNKLYFFVNLIYRGFISGLINKLKHKPIIFNGQSNFGYKLSSWLHQDIHQIELIHALNTFSLIRVPFLKNYRASVTVSNEIVEKHAKLYEPLHLPGYLMSRFSFIETRIELPKKQFDKNYYNNPLKVLYVGRGTEEKRVHIVAAIAEHVISKGYDVEFHFAGDVTNSIPTALRGFCKMHGNLFEAQVNELYNAAHILVVTSDTESGPLVIMEAMARGLAIITTDVGFVPAYLENEVHGLKVPADLEEGLIVNLMSACIERLYNDRVLLEKTGRLNMQLAFSKFNIESFYRKYKDLIDKFK